MDSATASSSVASDSRPDGVEARIKMTRVAIKFIVMAIWVSYVMVWLITPTKVYATSWWFVIMKKTNTVYFGIQGMAILIYTAPVLLAAVLGCVYLHLSTKHNLSRWKQQVFLSWRKRLCFTTGPLGIVSRTEVAFLGMFIILLLVALINYNQRGVIRITPSNSVHIKRSLVIMESEALWAGVLGNICLAFIFFPVTRGSSILPLFGLTYESSIKYHIWIGHISMVLFTAHGFLYVLFWAVTNDLTQTLKWDVRGISNVAGEVSLLAGIVMWLTTFPKIRRNMFELFFYTHYLYIIFILFFIFHIGVYGTCMMLPGFYLFVLDRYLRLLQSQQHVKLVSARVLPCEFIELNFAKSPGLTYSPTSTMFLNVPSISRLQWHPFTICSNSDLEPDTISVLIKTEGSWSRKLYQIMSSNPSIEHLAISIEGPYGPASTEFLKYETLVMVSGGSGITPFISIIRGLMHASSNSWKPSKVILVSAFKRSEDLTVLDALLPLSSSSPTPALSSDLNIQIEVYVTREQQPSKSSKAISTIWFKSRDSDTPISPTLGPNSWLCLAMIITASFAISLLLIAFGSHHFIYTVEKNRDNRSLETIIYIFSFCISIVVSASAAFMWNKRHMAKEGNKMENNAAPSPDFELESQPGQGQTLAQVINAHYGARPDFKGILDDCKGSSIGVLVCGPKEMQQDVSRICSCSTKDNVHCELFSFNW